MTKEMMVFDLDLTVIPFQVLDPKTKAPRDYEIRELDGEQRDDYLTSLAQRMKTDATGKSTGVRDFKGIQSALLKLCTFEKGATKPVEEKILQSWPARHTNKLFKEAKRISGLDDEADDNAKND